VLLAVASGCRLSLGVLLPVLCLGVSAGRPAICCHAWLQPCTAADPHPQHLSLIGQLRLLGRLAHGLPDPRPVSICPFATLRLHNALPGWYLDASTRLEPTIHRGLLRLLDGESSGPRSGHGLLKDGVVTPCLAVKLADDSWAVPWLWPPLVCPQEEHPWR